MAFAFDSVTLSLSLLSVVGFVYCYECCATSSEGYFNEKNNEKPNKIRPQKIKKT